MTEQVLSEERMTAALRMIEVRRDHHSWLAVLCLSSCCRAEEGQGFRDAMFHAGSALQLEDCAQLIKYGQWPNRYAVEASTWEKA